MAGNQCALIERRDGRLPPSRLLASGQLSRRERQRYVQQAHGEGEDAHDGEQHYQNDGEMS
jgi:hypothetical protein